MGIVVYLIIGIIIIVALKHWTKYTYHEGLYAGFKIATGVWRGGNVGDLGKIYDRYKK